METATSSELAIRLLGQADVATAGRSIKFAKRATTLAMIAYLVLRRRQPVARDFLAYTLFPDCDEESALAELRRLLYLASKALPIRAGEPWLIADNETVRFNVAAGATVDAVTFECLAASEATNVRAVDLYSGDLLEDMYDEWIVVERERLRVLYLQTLDALIARHRNAREYGPALGYAQRLLAADGWREDVARQAMAIRYAWGDAPGALAEYDRFAKRLRDEMSIDPMPETIALRHLILRNEPLAGAERKLPASTAGAVAGRTRVLPYIGRDDERSRLQQTWDRAARGFGNVVIVSGEAGIGKTRLTGELATIVEREGGRVYCGGTASPESPPYQCLVEALRAALPVLNAYPLPALTSQVLARVLPELRDAAPPALELAALAPDREAARLLDAFARAFTHVAASRPLLLVFEDLHWASGTTVEALATLGRRIAQTRTLLVGTFRDEDTAAAHPVRRLVTTLAHERRVTSLPLGRLDRDEVARVVSRVDGLSRNDDALAERLYGFSEGNPFFLSEAIADVLEDTTGHVSAVPSSIREVISARMERLSVVARNVAEVASVGGHGCNIDVVRDVTGFSMAETVAGFNELLDRRLLREASSRDRYDFVFTHHLIGSSIYETMPPALRVRRHARIAHVIEAQAAAGAEFARELARHYDCSAMPEEAALWSFRAAREAFAVYANDDAAAYAAITLRHRPADVAALFLREEANARLGKRSAQRADLDRLEELKLEGEQRCRVMRRRIALARALGERDAEREAIGRLEAAAADDDHYWRGVAASAYARLFVSVASYEEAKLAAREALRRFADTGDLYDRIEALSALVEAHASTGDFPEANRLLVEAETIAAGAGDPAALAEAHLQAATSFLPQQRFEDVERRSQEAAAAFRAIGDRVGEARALVNVATSALRLSHWAAARAANRSAADIFKALADRPGLARVSMNLGMLHARCGDFKRARDLLRAARELQIQLGDERGRTASLVNESFCALWQRAPQAALDLATEAFQRAEAIGHAGFRATALANLGAAERDLGRAEAAVAHMQQGLTLQLELGRMSDAVSDLADLALAHARCGDLGAAVVAAERVLAVGPPWTDAAVFPPYPPWAVSCVFHWTNDLRTHGVLRTAASVCRSYAASIDVPELRLHFERLPFVLEMEDAVANDRWPARTIEVS